MLENAVLKSNSHFSSQRNFYPSHVLQIIDHCHLLCLLHSSNLNYYVSLFRVIYLFILYLQWNVNFCYSSKHKKMSIFKKVNAENQPKLWNSLFFSFNISRITFSIDLWRWKKNSVIIYFLFTLRKSTGDMSLLLFISATHKFSSSHSRIQVFLESYTFSLYDITLFPVTGFI